jgi:hypothetical protein
MAERFELKSDTDSNDQHPLTGLAQQLPTLVSVSGAWRQFAQAPANFGFFHDRLFGFIEHLLYRARAERRKRGIPDQASFLVQFYKVCRVASGVIPRGERAARDLHRRP